MTTIQASLNHLNRKLVDITTMVIRLDTRITELSNEDKKKIRGLLNSTRWKTYSVYEMLRCMVINLGGECDS